jgi:PAS domain S-box-containing protein
MNTLPRWLLAATVLGMLAILGGGGWFYYTQRQYLRRDAEEELETIAQLKVDQIVQWRAARLGDASVLMEDPFFGEAVARWMADPQAAIADSLRTHFQSLQKHCHYDDVALVEPSGKARLSLSGELGPLDAEAAKALAASFHDRRPVFSLWLSGGDHPAPLLDVVAPLFTRNGPASAPLGAVVFWADARQRLFPLIQSWPRPSASAETMLVRREGDSVLYLNELRRQHNTALKLRVPLSQTNAPAVMAVLGHEGIFRGRDYRGLEVLSALKAVPGSRWFIVEKVDAAEAFAPWRFQSTIILGLIFGFMLVAATGFGILWQRSDKAHYRALYLGEAALRKSQERYSSLFENMAEGPAHCRMVFDNGQPRDFIYLAVNPAFEKLTGLRDVVGKKASELMPGSRESDPGLFETYGRVTLSGQPEHFETFVAALNHWFSVSAYSPDKEHFVAVFDVITERKRVEAALRASEQQSRAMFDTASVGIAQADPRTGQWLRVNPKMCEVTGHTARELLQMRVPELTHAEDRQRDWEAFQRVVRGEAPNYRLEKRYVRKDGSLVWVNVNMTVLRDAAGQPTRTIAAIEDITERKRDEEQARRHREQLRALSARVEKLREEERIRISREIHDELGQTLTAIKMDLRWMERRLDEFGDDRRVNPILDQLVATTELADATITTVQRIAADLRPGILDESGLPPALRYEAGRFEERTGIPCQVVMPSGAIRLRSEAATAFFRIFQEALTNVTRHAKARAVEVALQLEADGCRLEIRDDGRGMTAVDPAHLTSLGLLGMQERARLLGGDVTFGPRPGGGTVVTVRIPNTPAGEPSV